MSNVVHLPSDGGRSYWVGNLEFVTLKTTGRETNGEFALVELVALPGAEPPPHIHHRTDEVYYLLEGELDLLDGDRSFTAQAGAMVHIPKGRLHAWRNATATPVRALLFISPAGFEGVIEEVGIPDADLSSPPPTPPPPTAETIRRMHELGQKYDAEYPPAPAW